MRWINFLLATLCVLIFTVGCPPEDDDDVAGDDDVATDPCVEYCDTLCACEGADEEFQEAGLGDCETYCNESNLAGSGPDACQEAMDIFEAVGGCEGFFS